jgi:hypothetical protein
MSELGTRPGIPTISLTPPADEASRVAEYLGLILAGKPFPPELRPSGPVSRPSTVEEGLESILHGAF